MARNDENTVQRAMSILRMIDDPEKREEIISKMSESAQSKIRALSVQPVTEGEESVVRPHTDFSEDIAEKRRLIRESAMNMHERRIEQVRDGNDKALDDPAFQFDLDPLDQLRDCHPAALARALQGERAEAWAIVFDHLTDPVREALRTYLDHDARVAISRAATQQAELPTLLKQTVERAVRETIVERALREQQNLMTNPHQVAG